MAQILIIDDATIQANIMSFMLSKHGHEVMVVSDGEKGLNRANLLKPDLILMDIVMPGLNGFKATRQLAKTAATQHIPVLVISGKAQESDRQWALRQGACDYLVKPIQETSLLDKVNALLAAESPSSADGSASNA